MISLGNYVAANEQAEEQKKLDALKAEVDRRDVEVQQLQKSLKEAEGLLVSFGGCRIWPFLVENDVKPN